MKDIYVSTGGFKDLTGYEAALKLIRHGFDAIELSSGIYSPEVDIELRELNTLAKVQLHNYFPPPKSPFVLNLASNNPQIRYRSIEMVKRGIELAGALHRKYFSFHAGFRIDPRLRDLGGQVSYSELTEEWLAMTLFVRSLEEIADFAASRGVRLLIENNVCNLSAIKLFSCSPYLLDTPSSIKNFFRLEISKYYGLLLDVAHLKVSSNSLNFELEGGIREVTEFVRGYHLSDNDGYKDTNDKFDAFAWYWDFVLKDLDYYTIEVYTDNFDVLANQVDLARGLIN
jgi:sugar phosphate isomerase/epimerase